MYTNKSKPASLRPEYVVVKHPLQTTGNAWIMGVKFCNGVAVVAKNSKEHNTLKRSLLFKKRREFGLDWLPKFGFRTKDVSLIFGKDVFYAYLDAVGLGPDLKPLHKSEAEQQEELIVAYEKEEVEQIKEELKEELEEESVELDEPENVASEDEQEKSNETESIEEVQEEPEMTLEETIQMHMNLNLCVHLKDDGSVCKNKVSKGSPSGNYCFGHIKKDPALEK